MQMTHKILAAGIMTGTMCCGAQAAVLFSDTFDSASSGTGYADNYTGGTYSAGTMNNGGAELFRTFSSSIDATTMDFWLAVDMSITGSSGSWAGVSFFNAGTEDFFLGADSASTDWEFDTRGISDTNSGVANFTGTATTILLHITSVSIDMWVDPADTSSVAALGTADASNATNPITDQASWNRMRIGSGSPTVTMDNLTAATTFAEVVPEPGSLALLGLGGLALLRRRRA